MNRVETLVLDIGKENEVTEAVVIQQGENISLTINAAVTAYGDDLELSADTSAYLLCARPDGTSLTVQADIVSRNPAALSVVVPEAVGAVSGVIGLAYFLLEDSVTGWKATTDYFQITVTQGILDAEPAADDGTMQALIDACEAMAGAFAGTPNENRVEYLDLDVNKENEVAETIVLQQGENISLTIEATITESGRYLPLAEGVSAYFLCAKPDGTNVIAKAEVLTKSPTAVVSVDVPSSVCAAAGAIQLAYFMLNDPDTKWIMTTDAFQIQVTRGIDMGGIESTDDYQNLVAMLNELSARLAAYDAEWRELKTDAVSATADAERAAADANAAADRASAAVDDANAAVANANTAVSNANAAVAGANSATDRANEAAAAAQGIVDNVNDYMTRAETAAINAAASRRAAAISEAAAAESASEASSYASAAASSATSAGQSATAASGSASAAATSASNAATSAGNAASSESAAAVSANSASASKDAAYSHASSAAASAAAAEAAAEKAESIAGFTVDDTVTQESSNPVASKAVYNYVTQMFADFTAVTFSIVESYEALPAVGEVGTFYFVPAASTGTSDMYSEYVWLNGKYEKFGDIQMPDLSPYAKMTWVTEQITAQLASYYTKTQVDGLLAGKQDNLTFDAVPTSGSANPVKSGGVYSQLATKADTSALNALSDTVGGLQTAVSGKQDALTFDQTPTQNSSNPVTSGGVYTALSGKQAKLTFDATPTAGSANPVTSSGVKEYVDANAAKVDYLTNEEFLSLIGA